MGQRLILSEQEKKNIQEMYGLIYEQGDKEDYHKNSDFDPNMRKDFGSVENMVSDKITINGQTMPLQNLKANVRISKSGRESSNLGPVKVGNDLIFIGALQPKEIKTGDVGNVGEFLKMNGNALNRAMDSFLFWFETEGTNNQHRYDTNAHAEVKLAQQKANNISNAGTTSDNPKWAMKKYFELAGNPVWDKNKLATNYGQFVIFPFKITIGAEKLRDKLIQWDFTMPEKK